MKKSISVLSLFCLGLACTAAGAYTMTTTNAAADGETYVEQVGTQLVATQGFTVIDGAQVLMKDGGAGLRYNTAVSADFITYLNETYEGGKFYWHTLITGNIPLVSYGVKEEEIKALLDNGTVLMKIKIGFDDNGKKKKAEMLEWDKARLQQIHEIAKAYQTENTVSGKILYYLDANGKYDTVERLQGLLDYAREIGAIEQIVLLEEPFEEENKIFVGDMPVRIAADESVHNVKDMEERIALGYKAITLKPIAKTLSETLKILKKAQEKGVVCFCADLTVNPLLVEWNKNVAARIATLPEMKIGVLESNGEQNYVHWEELYKAHPCGDKPFAKCHNGIYILNDDFFQSSGGIFKKAIEYERLFF